MEKGKFIVICGTDGSGKETQARLLHNRLEEEGHKVKLVHFPKYGKRYSLPVKMYLNGEFGDDPDKINPKIASTFFAIDRYAASHEMKEWLEEGYIIIANRYVSANKGHQAGKFQDLKERDEFLEWLDNLEYNRYKIPREDKNILLYLPPELGQEMVDKKGKRDYTEKKRDIHEGNIQHLKNAAEAYLYVAKKENWEIIECSENGKILSIENIHEKMYDYVKKLLDI